MKSLKIMILLKAKEIKDQSFNGLVDKQQFLEFNKNKL